MKVSEISIKSTTTGTNINNNNIQSSSGQPHKPKPPFRPAQDDTKPVLQDPILRSDPLENEEAVLRLPPSLLPVEQISVQNEFNATILLYCTFLLPFSIFWNMMLNVRSDPIVLPFK
ncbi:hypothetical protein I3842_12G006200 [Carya illinoinensis]|uniref:Uncharacterized protein n=1 Tax=Carya illinoinensis TaxID=32201 RepID=A0A922DFC4_CARIL|nr:hypothetical protein I3842_12G006200 [Carya illinoinensis]